ncbi:MAG TPA: DNA polymerase III subunit gamma/tau [Candidatus Binataceae bacterium]|nr:DNA polymerase III subunit gamma/tau [Candidatus Binataceae bacterium]
MAESPPSHLVLARKWRPDRFGELVGQEHVTRTLSEALRRGRVAHAFLFTGIRGVGKTTAARILARCLNCEKGPTAEPCGECAACVEIRQGRSLDVSEIDGATYRKIDDARAIIENLSYRPARDRFKIYIIDEAHQLTDQAFNALLKTLEEPPAHVKFILATTEPQKMPETILSRLQRYDFRRIPFATILARLTDLTAREKIECEEAALRVIAREAGGSMRDAERMLETAIASASEARVTEAEVAASLGVASRTAVFKLAEAILAHNPAEPLRIVRELAGRGANLESLGRDLLETLRNLAVAKLPADGGPNPLDELPDHEAQEIRRLAASPSSRDLMRLFRLMADAQEEILRSPYPDLLLEMAVIRMASLAPVIDAGELLRAIGAAPSKPPAAASGGGGGREAARPPSEGSAPSARRLKVEGEVKAEAPLRAPEPAPPRDLPELRDHIRNRRAALAGFMEQGASLSLDGDVLRVNPRNDIYVRYLADNRGVLGELASEFYHRTIRVVLAGAGAESRTEPQRADAASPQPASSAAGAPALNGDRARPAAQPAASAPADTAAGAEDRQALYSDPGIRRIFDAFEARLVEVRSPAAPPARDGGGEPPK